MSNEADTDSIQTQFVFIWKANKTGEEADDEFQERIPRIMSWLSELQASGHLVACGGGSFEPPAGGITIIRANNAEHAQELNNNPLNEIGSTEIFLWDVYHADLQVNVNAFA